MSNTTTTHAFFDLFTYTEAIASPEIAAGVASSTAWKMDAMIVQAARAIYRTAKDHLVGAGVDTRAELTNALNEQAFAESTFDEIGSMVTGLVGTIKECSYQREAWHELARRLTPLCIGWDGRPKTYEPRSLEDQIFEPGQMQVNAQTRMRLKKSVERHAAAFGVPEFAEQQYQKKLALRQEKMVGLSENLRDQAQGVAFMLHCAQQYNLEDVDLKTTAIFSSLTLPTQRELIINAIQAAGRAEEYAIDNRALSDADTDAAGFAAIKVHKDLNAVLRTPRFTALAAQETAAEKATG